MVEMNIMNGSGPYTLKRLLVQTLGSNSSGACCGNVPVKKISTAHAIFDMSPQLLSHPSERATHWQEDPSKAVRISLRRMNTPRDVAYSDHAMNDLRQILPWKRINDLT